MIHYREDLTGKILGSCMLQKLIGQGGMSVVYLAQQTHPARQVAVKILLPRVNTGSDLHQKFLLRFQHEADIIANLEHLNIIPIYEYAEQDGEAYLVMPYLTGGTLSDVLDYYGTLSPENALHYIQQAASALDYAHARNVIHRDLKPGNFLIHGDGRLMLADFGIARMIQESGRGNDTPLTGSGDWIGTPAYMAPEMVRGEPVDPRTDIYELGIVLFQMLSGDVPFKGERPSGILIQHLQRPLPLLHPLNPAIPAAVDDVLQKATAKDREERFQSAGEMARALQAAIMRPVDPFADTIDATATVPIESFPPLHQVRNGADEHLSPGDRVLDLKRQEQQRPRGMLAGLVLVVLAALIMSGVLLAHALVKGPAASQTTTAVEQAQARVHQYYDDWNKKHYQAAYNLLSSSYRQQHSFSSLQSSYEHTEQSSVKVMSATQCSDGTVHVVLTDTATEKDPSSGASTKNVYPGYFVVQEENGAWTLFPHFFDGSSSACG